MRVALVHDYLTQAGGAERVLAALHEIWPDAPVLTAVVDRDQLPGALHRWDIRDHLLGRNPPARRDHRLLFPFYPAIFRDLGRQLGEVDVVVSDSSAWAHRIGVPDGIPHVCYCHSPARFLWNDAAYLDPVGLPRAFRPLSAAVLHRLRRTDQAAARRVDRYVANSDAVAARIRGAYGVDAPVVYPPVDIERFSEGPDPEVEDWFLIVSRLVPHKRIDLAIRACQQVGVPLKVIGTGRQEAALKRLAGPGVTLLGALSDDAVASYMRRCQGLIVPAVEDFGITAVEAQAAGRPVVSLRGGGALETVVDGETGLFFETMTPESLAAALRSCMSRAWDTAACRRNADPFRRHRFGAEMLAIVERAAAFGPLRAPSRRRGGGRD